MLGWGIALIAIGVLSFILPLLGRQFILVSLLGLTGMGSAIAGLVILGVGVLLFNAAQKKERSPSPGDIPSPQQPPPTAELKRESLFADGADGNVVTQKAFAAADAGDVDAQVLVGSAYLSGANGLPQDPEQAFHYLNKAAMQGHGFASFVLAGLYAEGLGIAQDFDQARLWASKAKQLGVADSAQMLAAIDAKRRA